MTRPEIIQQSMLDMNRVIIILTQILSTKELTDEEMARVNYCEKLLNNSTEKQNYLNATEDEEEHDF